MQPVLFNPGAQAQSGQDAPAEPQAQEKPIVIEEPAYEYFYWPDEDLNNFGLSSMGNGKSGTTMGSESERKSNIEVNSSLRTRKENEAEARQSPEPGASVQEAESSVPPPAADYRPRPRTPASDMYEWVDDKGVKHFTNNIGDVPLEYQRKYLEE